MLESALYIVPTPIGNLDDITLRAIEVLKNATLIAAEDTRHSKILLDKLGVLNPKMISCHDHNEEQRASIIIEEVNKGGIVALISDAGSPLINDPGYKVVTLCSKANVKVIPLPGPCALITALEASALPTDKFMFNGFFPVKEKELVETIESLKGVDYTAVFYEAPRRILNTMEKVAQILPEHDVTLCREMTKTFESFYRLKAKDAPAFLEADPDRTKGEFVVAIGALKEDQGAISPQIVDALKTLVQTTPVKVACNVVANLTGLKKNDLYNLALELKEKN
ncbi:MAG: 16S rRNA (cytidine(1402)-2'-O)-methyltransferase [Succinivibrio sp.]|nr:16S rRNA (cytidine(1402)-2'-O)-methyltransferase [Succinivibrio sp.]MCI5638269.1 16S rRNA (cytidine(1402)-2'-O)-methyltransferase [Succinivibrio sp.]MCI6448956.1 16S rRNA (cytidine(1402)-2'-O)-methyltransferase [Succinivibrio sp.]MDD6069139.1 16S rRNA (cytidine(1402)-2'-O)-methyltransferase [Succinivibrio sp.]MDY3107523.1 16S rRNA (cytidine(1402)-2'-O)-methyltransferase [Succinivibrio sp.]